MNLIHRLLCFLLGHKWTLVRLNWGPDNSEDYYPFWSEDYECEVCGKRKRTC